MIKSVFLYYLKNSKKYCFILSAVFLIGIIIGIYFVNVRSDLQISEMSGYMDNLKETLKSSESINKTEILIRSLKNNVCFVILLWFFGCTILGSLFIYIMVLYKGFSIGYTVSSIISCLGIKMRYNFFSDGIGFTKYCSSANYIIVIS